MSTIFVFKINKKINFTQSFFEETIKVKFVKNFTVLHNKLVLVLEKLAFLFIKNFNLWHHFLILFQCRSYHHHYHHRDC